VQDDKSEKKHGHDDKEHKGKGDKHDEVYEVYEEYEEIEEKWFSSKVCVCRVCSVCPIDCFLLQAINQQDCEPRDLSCGALESIWPVLLTVA
jgi:hypothetical protein